MEANEMKPRTWDESGQALQELERRHDEMGGPFPIRRFELEDDLAGRRTAQPFVAEGRARDVATATLNGMPWMGTVLCVGGAALVGHRVVGNRASAPQGEGLSAFASLA